LRPTDECEIIETISDLNANKPPGHIDIPVTLIKASKNILAHYLAISFTKSLEIGNYPDVLKVAKLILLHKGGYHIDLNHYRPISILTPLNKIF